MQLPVGTPLPLHEKEKSSSETCEARPKVVRKAFRQLIPLKFNPPPNPFWDHCVPVFHSQGRKRLRAEGLSSVYPRMDVFTFLFHASSNQSETSVNTECSTAKSSSNEMISAAELYSFGTPLVIVRAFPLTGVGGRRACER